MNLKFQISIFTHNEGNDSLKKALNFFENHANIVNIQRKKKGV